MQDSVKPSGYLQCWRERNRVNELLLAEHNTSSVRTISDIILGMLFVNNDVSTYNSLFGGDRVYKDIRDMRLDGMIIGSYKEAAVWNCVWGTWAGTFAFGTNSNFNVLSSNYSSDAVSATCYGTFNFTDSQIINFISLGCGSMAFVNNNNAYVGKYAWKELFGTNAFSFTAGDIFRVNWSMTFA